MSYLKEELAVFDIVELWFYVISRIRNGQEHVWIVEGGEA